MRSTRVGSGGRMTLVSWLAQPASQAVPPARTVFRNLRREESIRGLLFGVRRLPPLWVLVSQPKAAANAALQNLLYFSFFSSFLSSFLTTGMGARSASM